MATMHGDGAAQDIWPSAADPPCHGPPSGSLDPSCPHLTGIVYITSDRSTPCAPNGSRP